MRTAIRTILVLVFGTALAVIAADLTTEGVELKRGWDYAVWAVLAGSALVVVATTGPVVALLSPDPRMAAAETREERRDAVGGPDLQVITAPIFNKRDSGGERATAIDVVPWLEAYRDSERVAETQGNWLVRLPGALQYPTTVTFRPTRERCELELVSKFPTAEDAWLAGANDPMLGPGEWLIRASLRGKHLKRPAVLEWKVHNPGRDGLLTIERKRPSFWRRIL